MDTYEKKYKEALEWARKVMQGKVGFVLDEVLEKFPELKESEDEKIISDAEVWLDTLCDYLKDSSSAYIPNVRVVISNLKSLKDRVKSQPKQEWSKKDESMRTRCIGILGKCYMGELPTKVEEELNWLKSLNPQSQWKPSDEQMSILWDALCTLKHENYKHLEIVKSLYQDLKKLRKE